MNQVELDGGLVLRWIKEVGHEAASTVLVGCGLDNQIDDELLVINSIDPSYTLHCRLGSVAKRIPAAKLCQSLVVDSRPGQPLRVATDRIKSPGEIELAEAAATLRRLGISPGNVTRSSDIFVLIAALEDHTSQKLPTPVQQCERYEVLKRTNLLRHGARIIRGWRDFSLRDRHEVDAGILIKLAYCLRHSGETEAALRVSEPVVRFDPGVSMSPGQKGILATERAAALLDLYEKSHDTSFLKDSRRCAGISWAISPSEEANLVYQRLKKLEREHLEPELVD